MSSYKRITTVHDRPLGVKQYRVTLECGHQRVLDSYPSDLAFREGCACDECHSGEEVK